MKMDKLNQCGQAGLVLNYLKKLCTRVHEFSKKLFLLLVEGWKEIKSDCTATSTKIF